MRPIVVEEISLENFQSIFERTTFPIKPITFLFGPNSAGKSAIFDLLKFLDAFFHKNGNEFIRCVNEYWHHGSTATTKPEMTVGIKFKLRDEPYNSTKISIDPRAGAYSLPVEFAKIPSFLNWAKENGGRIEVFLKIQRPPFSHVKVSLKVSLNGHTIINLSQDNQENYKLTFCGTPFEESFIGMCKRHGAETIGSEFEVQCEFNLQTLAIYGQNNIADEKYIFHKEIISLANYVIDGLTSIKFEPYLVDGSRGVIASNELRSFVSSQAWYSGGPMDEQFGPASVDIASGWPRSLNFGIPVDIIEKFAAKDVSKFIEFLAISGFARSISSRLDKMYPNKWHGVICGDTLFQSRSEYLHEIINRWLSDNLFTAENTRSYQLAFSVSETSVPGQESVSTTEYPHQNAAIVFIYLLDQQGRPTVFEEVGSGVSCILPVLVASLSGCGFIQQPELHLHPALQSGLGDVFIEATKITDGNLIIETHSEYALLRCLKRIRQTHHGQPPLSDEIRLSNTDIAVLYFDPQVNGSTKIKRLNITPEGDFVERWPRGFFEERGRELFDE